MLFPDEVYDLLCRRIDVGIERTQNESHSFRTFGLVRENVCFEGVPEEKRGLLAEHSIDKLFTAPLAAARGYAELFWAVAGNAAAALGPVLKAAKNLDDEGAKKIVNLIRKAPRRLALTNPNFAKELLENFAGMQRLDMVNAFAYGAVERGPAVFVENAEDEMAQRKKKITEDVAVLSSQPGLEDLARAIREL